MTEIIEGMEGTTVRAINYPAIGLAQAQTPEVLKKVKGFSAGVIYTTEFDESDNRTRKPLGEAVELIVYKIYPGVPRSKYNSRNDDDLPMFDCMSIDGKVGTKYGTCASCSYTSFDLDSEDRCCTQSIAVVAPKDQPDNFKRLIFQKSNFNVGEKMKRLLASEVRKHKLSAIYEMTITLTSKSVENTKRKAIYSVYDVKSGTVLPEALRVSLKENYEQVKEQYDLMYEQFIENLKAAEEEAAPPDSPNTAAADAINQLNAMATTATPVSGDALL